MRSAIIDSVWRSVYGAGWDAVRDALADVRPSQAPPDSSFLETIDNDLKEETISLYHICEKAA